MKITDKLVSPMLLKEVKEVVNDEKYLYEIKFDGIRALIYLDKNTIIIKNRKGYIMTDTYPELSELKSIVGNKKCIFDGEIVLMYNDRPSFSKLQERALLKNSKKIEYFKKNYPVTFVCFDIIYENKNLTNLTLVERKNILSKYKDNTYFVKTKVFEDGEYLFDKVKRMDLEGIVAKRKDSLYLMNERNSDWIKIKNVKDGDFFIGGYREKKDNPIVSLIICDKVNDNLKYICKVSLAKRKDEFKLIKKSKTIKNKFIDFDEDDYIFIEPKLKCTIEYLEKTKNGHLRHPVFKGLRLDK